MVINNLKINRIILRNFLSIGNNTQTVNLDNNGMTLVLGNNVDSSGMIARNGSGKTTILQGLSFALFGSPLTKIKVDNLINNINQKAMYVIVEFEKNGINYRIERGRKPNVMKFYKGDSVISDSKGENTETQNDIETLLGMTHTMFKHIVALNTYTDPFLKLPAADQRKVIEELMGITQISMKAELLKKQITKTEENITRLDAKISATKAANTRIQTSLDKVRNDSSAWERTRKETILENDSQLEIMSQIDFDKELKIFDEIDQYSSLIETYKNDLHKITNDITHYERLKTTITTSLDQLSGNNDDYYLQNSMDRIDKEIDRHRASILQLEKQIEECSSQIAHFSDMLENPDDQDCKTCGQKLQGTDHLEYVIGRFHEDKAKAEHSLVQLETHKNSILNTIDDLEHDKEKLKSDHANKKSENINRENDLNSELETVKEKLVSLHESKMAASTKLNNVGDIPETLFNNRDEIYALKYSKDALMTENDRLRGENNPFSSQITALENAIQKIDMEPVNEEMDTLKHQKFLLKLLTSKDSFIRRKIIEKNLNTLNSRLSFYLLKLGLPHQVIFQSDLSVEINLLGRDFDFAQLSRGESNRVIMATSWAFRDVWESLNHRINLLFIDELLDNGTDSLGAEAALQVLKEFGRQDKNVFLISHRDELVGRIENVLMVNKENDFTSIDET